MAYIVKSTVNLELVGQGPIYSKTHSISEAEGVWHELQLATASVDSAVNFGGVTTGDIVLLSSDQTISWRCAATDTAIALDANRVHLLVGTNLTAILLSNASGSTANVKVLVAGA